MRCRIGCEFEFDFQEGENYNEEILSYIEEDIPEVIQAAFDNITEGIERKTFKVGKL